MRVVRHRLGLRRSMVATQLEASSEARSRRRKPTRCVAVSCAGETDRHRFDQAASHLEFIECCVRREVGCVVVEMNVGMPDPSRQHTVFDVVGGFAFFTRLVDHFYDGVEADPVLLGLYPDPDDLGPARERLTLFLGQYWGGPTAYSDERGHPRLRMRHAPFAIGVTERDHWLAAMRVALDAAEVDGDPLEPFVKDRMWQYFEMSADAMRNTE